MDGSTVVLRGSVRDDHERRLAEALVRLTPGVRAVRNELTAPGGSPSAGP
jgi:osmotically-inducible protein OsmY